MAFLDFLDPTIVRKADTSGVEQSKKKIGEATETGQALLQKRMDETKAPTVEKVAGPQAGKIDTGFLDALRGQLPSGQQALDRSGTQGVQAQQQAAEGVGMLREAALGQTPSAAALLQNQAFEQAIAAQAGAMAGRGYDPAAMRQAQVGGMQLQAQQAQQAGILAAQEQERARTQYATAAQAGAGLGLQQQELALRAAQGDVNAQLQLATIQSQTLGQNAQLATQSSIAGAQIGAQQAGQQAELQAGAQAQINALAQAYMNAGMTGAQAQAAAEQALFKMESERQQQVSAGRSQLIGGLIQGAATVGAGMATGGASAALPKK
jgi:hypothetical protein